jgi:preprotein translocase subunit SecG
MRTAIWLAIFAVLIAVVLLQHLAPLGTPRSSGRNPILVPALVVMAFAATTLVMSATRLLEELH